ncbi:MAG: hypothetical protein E6J90_48005 [Deltaproteobacteria bacterium]|nr:MAG: hypothetical protein E6J91_49465 [Deltaproteobacteria bacterium]TMQ05774.1 MAG: hypothetical protein E6J90_48005 [Deltaproteobacteria bacterium]
MIALCQKHHDLADGGQFTKQQLRDMKANPYVTDRLQCEWVWQPESILVLLGTMAFIGPRPVLWLAGVQVVAVRREEVPELSSAVMRVDFDLRAPNGTTIATMKDNIFDASVEGLIIETPPQGRRLELVHSSETVLALELRAYELQLLRALLEKTFSDNGSLADVVVAEALANCTDSDGKVPVLKIHGTFFQLGATLRLTAKRSELTIRWAGGEEKVDIGGRLFHAGSGLSIRSDGIDHLRFGS